MTTPDPVCRWCGGTGMVPMLNSLVECDCVKIASPEKRDSTTDAVIELIRRHLAVE